MLTLKSDVRACALLYKRKSDGFSSCMQTAYSASKAGLNAVSEGLRRELKPFGIDVVIIAPGIPAASSSLISRSANSASTVPAWIGRLLRAWLKRPCC